MKITEEWLASIKDQDGLTKGQKQVLEIWEKLNPAWGYLPDQVAIFLEGCKGYRGMSQELKDWRGL